MLQPRTTSLLALAVSLGLAATAAAQPGGADGRGRPAVGELMPNLAVYDRDGQESRLPALLNGRFTVLILGCLT